MSTSARVLELLALLQSRASWSGGELAHRLEVSPRTLRRDIGTLQELGYPVTSTRGTDGGYRLGAGAVMPPLVVTTEEAAAIVLGLRRITSDAATAQPAITALTKVLQVLPRKARRHVSTLANVKQVSLGAPQAPVPDWAVLTTVAMATRDGTEVLLTYTDRQGRDTQRHVHPHELLGHDRRLYAVAYDLLRDGWRVFRLDRITRAEPTGVAFPRRQLPYEDADSYLSAHLVAARSRYTVVARVQADVSWVREKLGTECVVGSHDHGWCEVRMPADDLAWVLFVLLSLDRAVEVCAPQEATTLAERWGRRLGATAPTADHAVHDSTALGPTQRR